MKGFEACRHCNGENIPKDDQETYIGTLCKNAKVTLEDKIAQIETAKKSVPSVSFVCYKCLKISTLSFEFHKKTHGSSAYSNAWAYYNSLTISTGQHKSDGRK